VCICELLVGTLVTDCPTTVAGGVGSVLYCSVSCYLSNVLDANYHVAITCAWLLCALSLWSFLWLAIMLHNNHGLELFFNIVFFKSYVTVGLRSTLDSMYCHLAGTAGCVECTYCMLSEAEWTSEQGLMFHLMYDVILEETYYGYLLKQSNIAAETAEVCLCGWRSIWFFIIWQQLNQTSECETIQLYNINL